MSTKSKRLSKAAIKRALEELKGHDIGDVSDVVAERAGFEVRPIRREIYLRSLLEAQHTATA